MLFVKYKNLLLVHSMNSTSIVTLYSLFPKRLFDETVNSLAVGTSRLFATTKSSTSSLMFPFV